MKKNIIRKSQDFIKGSYRVCFCASRTKAKEKGFVLFSLRKNSNNDRKNNAKINYKNWKDIVMYPEHKNKSKELLSEEDLEENIQLIDRTKKFEKEVEKFARDQRWRNKNISQNVARDRKDEKEMEKWLENKEVISNYTLQENAVFFLKKFGGNRDKIKDYYIKAFEASLEATGIDKKRIVFATIHFDQSNPHLHFSISNLKRKNYKTLGRELTTVNGNEFNPINWLKKEQNRVQSWVIKNKLTDNERSELVKQGKINLFKSKYAEALNFHNPIIKKLNNKYSTPLYKNKEDHISMEKIRGYKRNVSDDKLDSLEWHNLKNSLIFKFRKTKLSKELESAIRLNENNPETLLIKKLKYINQYSILEEKYTKTKNNTDNSLKPNIPEQNMLNKKKYFLRKDLDLFMIFGKSKFKDKTNDIYKNRLYNKLLYFCHERKTTPQELIKLVYSGKYIPKKYDDKTLTIVQKTILQSPKAKFNESLINSKDSLKAIRKRLESNLDDSLDSLKLFMKIDVKDKKEISPSKEWKRSNKIGVDSNFVKIVRFNSEIKNSELFTKLNKKLNTNVSKTKSFKKIASDKLRSATFSNSKGIKGIIEELGKKSVVDQLDNEISKELREIAKIAKNIEYEKESEEIDLY